MRSLLLRSLLVALLIGPLVTFVSAVVSVRTTVEYVPGLSEDEIKSFDNRTVSDLEAFMQSRAVKFTRYQWLRESIGEAYFWKGIARGSLWHCIGIFLGCLIVGSLERRSTLPRQSTTSD
jgi:hypothetical protein